ncbi:MAG: hypothetical protein XD78_1016 [Desulfotomaculum sp. 46_296]|nr:MAG: hypothetical protein XD78_1016 [Desulfotomaculum sp. 46_296]
MAAIWCFCSSSLYVEAVRKIDQKLNVTNATLVKVPFDLEYWQEVAAEKYPHGLPEPYSDDPTQWIFHGYPAVSSQQLQVAVARLLGYRWPAEEDNSMQLAAEARDLIERCRMLDGFSNNDGIILPQPDQLQMTLTNGCGMIFSNSTVNYSTTGLLSGISGMDASVTVFMRW